MLHIHSKLTSSQRSLSHKARKRQEAQLMLTNQRDTFRGQSRSPNVVPFHRLCIISSCAIVTVSLRSAVFPIFDFKKCHELEIQVKGHSRSLKMVPFGRPCVVSY